MILKLKGVCRHFGGLLAVKDFDLNLEAGHITGLIGPNGSGKTTLLNLISGFLKPNEGRIIFEERPIQSLNAYEICELGISRSFQTPQLFGDNTVLEKVMVGGHIKSRVGKLAACIGLPSAIEDNRRIKELALKLLRQSGIADLRDAKAASLPFGKKHLLEIARALACQPRLLLLDEPCGGLSHSESDEICEFIVSLKKQGLTILMVEHNMPVIMGISDHLVVMNEGQKLFEGSPLAAQSDERVISAYLGGSWRKLAHS